MKLPHWIVVVVKKFNCEPYLDNYNNSVYEKELGLITIISLQLRNVGLVDFVNK